MHDFKTGVFVKSVSGNCCGIENDKNKNNGLKFTPSGKAVFNFSVACHSETKEAETTFIEVTLWQKCAEKMNEVFEKGKAIILENGIVALKKDISKTDGKTYYHLKYFYPTKIQFEVNGEFVNIPVKDEDYPNEEKKEEEVEIPHTDGKTEKRLVKTK